VDDHPAFRRMARRLLTAAGFRVVGEAATAHDAVDVVTRVDPEFVLLDVLLPDGNGIDVADRLRESSAAFVVLTSSRTRTELADAVQTRPFVTKAELTIERLREMCRDR
jgi:DNA-binding NarL/FixJ family response regulator